MNARRALAAAVLAAAAIDVSALPAAITPSGATVPENLLRIELHTRQDNGRAIALYEALGFEHEGRLRGAFRVGTVEYDDLVMGLRLHAEPHPTA